MKKRLLEKNLPTDPLLVPVLMHEDHVVVGFTLCNRYLQALGDLKGNEAWLENVRKVATEVYDMEKLETENKSFFDSVKELPWWIFLIVAFAILVVVGGAVFIFIRRDFIHVRWKFVFSFFEMFLLTGSLIYLVNMANTKKQYVPETSLAGCWANSSGGIDCDTWAERMVEVSQGGGGADEKEKQQAQKAVERIWGEGTNPSTIHVGTERNDSKTSQNQVIREGFKQIETASQELYDKAKKNLESEDNENKDVWSEANKILNSIKYDGTNTNGKKTLRSSFGEMSDGLFEIDIGTGKYNITPKTAATINPSATYVTQVNEINGISCSNLSECETELQKLNNNTRNEYEEYRTKSVLPAGITDGKKYFEKKKIYQYDSQTGTIIETPVVMGTVNDFCTVPTVTGGHSKADGEIACRCDNGSGGYVYTIASGGSDCDAVCRVRNLTCDTCNPPAPEPEVPPAPKTPNTPYCGDGILGNTSGEQCEKGDPSGVKCAWATCNNCKCPTITDIEPFCGDGKINVPGEQCEVGDPSGTSCKWDTCNKANCKCITPGCGDGKLDAGEKCEKGDPTGTTCKWDTCNQLKCQCKEDPLPSCGDGKLDTGEKCEAGNPTGTTCLWEECDKTKCLCDVKVSEYCGDGNLQDGEQCEYENPSGVKCEWEKCSKSTCLCPLPEQPHITNTFPQTSIFDNKYVMNIFLGILVTMLGIAFYPKSNFANRIYFKIGESGIKVGRYVANIKKKNLEDKFK